LGVASLRREPRTGKCRITRHRFRRRRRRRRRLGGLGDQGRGRRGVVSPVSDPADMTRTAAPTGRRLRCRRRRCLVWLCGAARTPAAPGAGVPGPGPGGPQFGGACAWPGPSSATCSAAPALGEPSRRRAWPGRAPVRWAAWPGRAQSVAVRPGRAQSWRDGARRRAPVRRRGLQAQARGADVIRAPPHCRKLAPPGSSIPSGSSIPREARSSPAACHRRRVSCAVLARRLPWKSGSRRTCDTSGAARALRHLIPSASSAKSSLCGCQTCRMSLPSVAASQKTARRSRSSVAPLFPGGFEIAAAGIDPERPR